MPFDLTSFLQELVVVLPAVLFAITFHEVAHGWVADRLGDPTARLSGRLTLNPIAHLDPIGTIMMILVKFGWAKPIPVNPMNLRHPLRDMIWVAAAGPVANLIVAAVSLLLYRWSGGLATPFLALPFRELLKWSFIINLNLAAFNLIPIPPLDGSQILKGLLPRRQLIAFERIESYGFLILVLFLATGMAQVVLGPLVAVLYAGIRFTLSPLL
jgi:Zn-dependent protease